MPSIVAIFSTLILGLFSISLSDVLYSFKKILSSLCLRLYRRLKQGRLDFYEYVIKGEPEKVGFITHPVEWQLESPQSESHLATADDEIFFYGVNSKGECLIVSISRLCNNKAEAKIYLRLASGKTFKLERNLDFQQSVGDKKTFSCGGLQIYTLRPMKRWRIFYSGYLKEISEETSDVQSMAYVKFSFMWRASSDSYDSTFDMNPSRTVESIARADWKHIVPPVKKLFDVLDFYAQAGVIYGTVFVDGHLDDYEVYLFGEKVRFLGDVSINKGMEFSHTLGVVHESGWFMHFGQASIANIAEKMNYGFVVKADGHINKLEKIELSTQTDLNADDIEEITGKIDVGRSYLFSASITQPALQASNTDKSVNVNHIKFFLHGRKGSGIQIKWKIHPSSAREISDIVAPVTIPECVYPMVTAFTEDLCQLSEITGGKGSSLGMLKVLSGKLQSFSVPTGVVVTTSSYKQFINENILSEIKRLEDVLYGNKDGDEKEACKRVHDKIMATKFPNPVIEHIIKNLKKLFGEDYRAMKFAVRSSATGEDTEQMSAAGQMDTFLGVTGLNNILTAVKRCWASQFGFIAVQYKRRYGQCLNSPMAVVIQEMVACDRAGVIFTCDPVSGYSNKMSIAANFGLGESVVSSAVEPDTIELIRDENDELRINTVTVGSKNQKIVLTDAGTTQEDIPQNQKQECCLSAEEILRLGDLAVKIEKNYRSKRDIEWGMQNNRIYIFQSRPVTSGTQETDFEIEHEFDSSMRVENDYISVANTGEVLPGALPPLSIDVFLNALQIIIRGHPELKTVPKTRYFLMKWITMYNHLMFNVQDIFPNSCCGRKTALEKANMVSGFGRVLNDDEMFKVTEARYAEDGPKTAPRDTRSTYTLVKSLFLSGTRLENVKKSYRNYRIPVEKYQTSKDLFNALLEHCCDLGLAFMIHMYCSSRSALGNMLIFAALAQDKEELDNDVYTDFAKLATMGGNVESSDVPASIQNLVCHISKFIKPEEFKAMKTEEALRWLTDTSSPIGKSFTEFIKKHGHRCFKELDIYSPSWRSDPKPLVKLLQSKAGSVSREAAKGGNPSVLKLIRQLKTPLGYFDKFKLLFFIPLTWKGIQGREISKSLIVKGIDVWREGYWQLAKLMVSEGRIPNEKILFFMSLEEVKELLDNRSPKILAKAHHRLRLFQRMNDYMFPEMMRGFPRPMNTDVDDTSDDENLTMHGLPVSQGIAKGYVRVAITIDDAAHLKPGEILLAHGTDIGWSPYFPILAGVATELGGICSHGAVVSREYGLPCVAGLHGATRRFRTGDYVLLDGNKGVLKKIQESE